MKEQEQSQQIENNKDVVNLDNNNSHNIKLILIKFQEKIDVDDVVKKLFGEANDMRFPPQLDFNNTNAEKKSDLGTFRNYIYLKHGGVWNSRL